MKDWKEKLTRSGDISFKIGHGFHHLLERARDRFSERIQKAFQQEGCKIIARDGATPRELWEGWRHYATDFVQRVILFWDTMRQRGDNYLAHEVAGKPPVLHFKYETVIDGRKLKRPVNYALVRIIPPEGVKVDAKRRPYVIIDPRAGHGPGVGGFKDDSQVGEALRAGHPVYFVIFFPTPEPGQTQLDVCVAEGIFLHKVRELHPKSPKPAVVGNCQGGWATMMLAASNPDETGPIVINGAPMSYWGGAWSEGEGDNPMRYLGGLMGGSWMASLGADLGDGIFDGAYLVENMELLNPANMLWDKYYRVFDNIDAEPSRFLDFERWFGGYYLLNRDEMEWIVQNLFVGNKLWKGEVKSPYGKPFDLKQIKTPIILFASMGDNITPPQQAFNWVGDVYGSTDEIKARGQTIIGLLHPDIGHLGIFVSGKVARKEHKELVAVMDYIEALPPGLYGMKIVEEKKGGSAPTYTVEFEEHRLEEVGARLNRFKRIDEKPFEAVEAVAEFNQRAYELFARPLVQTMTTRVGAELSRMLHPNRVQHWGISGLNPWLLWLIPAARAAQANRRPAAPDHPLRHAEHMISETLSASLDLFRDLRDALSEATFFSVYGNMFLLYLADKEQAAARAQEEATLPEELPFVKEALAAIGEGGYPEALARVGALLARHGQPIPLAQLELKEELIAEYKELVPKLTRDQMRRIRGEQEIIVRYAPERALATLPRLLSRQADRKRLLTLLDHILFDKRIHGTTPAQQAQIERIRKLLPVATTPKRRRAKQAAAQRNEAKPVAARRRRTKRAPAARAAGK